MVGPAAVGSVGRAEGVILWDQGMKRIDRGGNVDTGREFQEYGLTSIA